MIRAIFLAILAVATASGLALATIPPWSVAAVFGDSGQPIGTAYRAGGVVRTVAHVAEFARGVGWPREMMYGVSILCRDVGTDSATLDTAAPLADLDVGDLPPLGGGITLVGYRFGRAVETFTSKIIGTMESVRTEDGVVVGPVVLIKFLGSPRGMSGGPVLYRNRVVATIALFNGEQIYAVPLAAAKCGTR